jgi:hypothetical protein
MILSDARDWLRRCVRDGTDDTLETPADVDRAIQQAGNYFCRQTRYVKKTMDVAITEGSTAFLTTLPIAAGFLPERILDVWITGEETPVHLIDYPTLAKTAARDATAGVPTALAFLDTTSNGLLWREPDDDYTARLRFWQPFGVVVAGALSLWTPGTATSGTLLGTLNIPDDIIEPVITLGAAGILKLPTKEFKRNLWDEFKVYCGEMRGAGGLGARVTYMDGSAAFSSSAPLRPADRPGADG